jgi:hypothetical protein
MWTRLRRHRYRIHPPPTELKAFLAQAWQIDDAPSLTCAFEDGRIVPPRQRLCRRPADAVVRVLARRAESGLVDDPRPANRDWDARCPAISNYACRTERPVGELA